MCDTWVQCLNDSGYFNCPEGDTNCLSQAYAPCQGQVEACLQGEQSCGGVWDCVSVCPSGDPFCPTLCFYEGTLDAQDGYNELARAPQKSIRGVLGQGRERKSQCGRV